MIITFCLGIFFLIPLSVTHALDFGTNVLVQATDKQLLKMKLDDEALTIFLIDTSGNMQNKDKQTTIDLINRFAVESEQARIAVIAYDNDSQVLVAPTTDSTVIREKLSTLESSGESNLTAGLKTAEELIKQSQNQKANIFIIADNAPTAGDTLKKGTYTSKDSHSYKYANAADEYAKQLKKSKVSIRTLIYLARVAKSTQAQAQRFFENIQNDGSFDISQNDYLDFLFERQRTNETLLTGQFDYGVRYGHRDAQTQFHYSDDYFKASSDAYQNKALPYNPSLATMSLNLELAAWASPNQKNYLFKSDNAKILLTKLGFTHFEANDAFKLKPTKDSIGAVIAEKKLTVEKEDYTLQQKLGQALGLDDITRELNSSALELFGDFILKHPNLTLTLFENLKIVGAAHQPEICLAWLRSQDKNYTEPLPILQNRKRSAVVEEKKTYYKTNVIIEGLAFGKILGGGVTQEFDKAELYAIPFENGQFDGWYKDGTLISKELECDYTVTEESTLVARFSAIEESANEK